MYKKGGINDVKAFYAEKFVHDQSFDFSKIYMGYYHIDFAKMVRIYENVRLGSRVLDFGCGSGTLSILKKKGCEITGIDYSKKALEIAVRVNKYDSVFQGSIFDFKHEQKYFDFIVSLDVFGHIPFEEKDAVIVELKKYLKPDGMMIHGIECGEVDYENMTHEELADFVKVDGHVGIEGKKATIERFSKFFKHVEGDVRFNVENSVSEYIKQVESYGSLDVDRDLLNYLKNMTPLETQAFNIAMGFVQLNLEKYGYRSPEQVQGGFLFLKASNRKIEKPFFEKI